MMTNTAYMWLGQRKFPYSQAIIYFSEGNYVFKVGTTQIKKTGITYSLRLFSMFDY